MQFLTALARGTMRDEKIKSIHEVVAQKYEKPAKCKQTDVVDCSTRISDINICDIPC